MRNDQPALRLAYANDPPAAMARIARHRPLGVVMFGEAPSGMSACPLHVSVDLASGGSGVEIWHIDQSVEPLRHDQVAGAVGGGYAFGAIEVNEDPTISLDHSIARAYRQLFMFLDRAGGYQPIRFWNYLYRITDDQDGVERYWRFNIGRKQAFQEFLTQDPPPVATCIGCRGARSVIYCLAAREAAVPLENPRQVSAFAYPPCHGPVSPGFSRASRHHHGGTDTLFISGTASIVGHESRHIGDFPSQLRETMHNLALMMDLTERDAAPGGVWAVKTYLRDPRHAAALDAALRGFLPRATRHLHLVGEICRKDLLVEIEATRSASKN